MKVFVLNLERAVERHASMLAQVAAHALDAEILTAVEGVRIDRATLPAGTRPTVARNFAVANIAAPSGKAVAVGSSVLTYSSPRRWSSSPSSA